MFSQTTVPESRGEKRFPGSFRSTANILMMRRYISHDDDRPYVSLAFLLPFLANPSRLPKICLRLTLGNWRNDELRSSELKSASPIIDLFLIPSCFRIGSFTNFSNQSVPVSTNGRIKMRNTWKFLAGSR